MEKYFEQTKRKTPHFLHIGRKINLESLCDRFKLILSKYGRKKNSQNQLLPYRKSIAVLLVVLLISVSGMLGVSTVKANLIQLKRNSHNFYVGILESFKYYPPKKEIAFVPARTLPVLVYHGIVNKTESDKYAITRDQFREQMIRLYESGYRSVTVEDFDLFMKGKKELPANSFLLTFDDGRKDSYYGADPVLKKLGYSAVMFVAVAQSLGEENLYSDYYLNEIELKQMEVSSEWEIESHAIQEGGGFITVDATNHQAQFLSNRKWLNIKNRLENEIEYEQRINRELADSKNSLEKLLQKKVILFSYPFSDYGQDSINNATSAQLVIAKSVRNNYLYAFQQLQGFERGYIGNYPRDDSMRLRRVEPQASWTGQYLENFLESGRDILNKKQLDLISYSGNLKQVWGSRAVEDSKAEIILRVNKLTKSSFLLLDGSRSWDDYMFTADVRFNNEGVFSLYSNVEKPGTENRCVWTKNSINVEQLKNGTIVKKMTFSGGLSSSENSFSILTKDGMIGCFTNGELQAAMYDENHEVGGIGLEYWSNDDTGMATVRSASVDFDIRENLEKVREMAQYQKKSIVQDVSLRILEATLARSITQQVHHISSSQNLASSTTFKPFKWGNISVIHNADKERNDFTTNITQYESGSAYWYWPEITVSSTTDYEISGGYSSDVHSVLLAEIISKQGEINWTTIREFPPSQERKNYSYIFQVPENATSFRILQSISDTGVLTVFSPSIKELESPSFDQGYITLCFDDGLESFYSIAAPLLKKYGIKATIPVITSHVVFDNYMTVGQLQKMEKEGHEISSHTRNHAILDNKTLDEKIITEISGSMLDLRNAGFKVNTFVFPYGSFSDKSLIYTDRSGYSGARSSIRGYNSKNTDIFTLKDQLIEQKTSLEEISGYVDFSLQRNKWLILELHGVEITSGSENSETISRDKLENILKIVKDKRIRVITLSEGLNIMKN